MMSYVHMTGSRLDDLVESNVYTPISLFRFSDPEPSPQIYTQRALDA